MKRKLNPIEEYAPQIVHEISRWNYILENGCNDPFWPDGCNMNLIRNHIISYKLEIAEYCKATGAELPPEYYLPTPQMCIRDRPSVFPGCAKTGAVLNTKSIIIRVIIFFIITLQESLNYQRNLS